MPNSNAQGAIRRVNEWDGSSDSELFVGLGRMPARALAADFGCGSCGHGPLTDRLGPEASNDTSLTLARRERKGGGLTPKINIFHCVLPI